MSIVEGNQEFIADYWKAGDDNSTLKSVENLPLVEKWVRAVSDPREWGR